ncbi:hypothetical protein PIIN_06450 [Serendipita indica DSM 11827]|uniref:Uncharacterized protein n=1 Tax=Serendipita indica (strain DSM 11827) TaxID=1109443 RepID=G4TMG8_SERID|nr:hypothetical protein PIIN_06450 [Serendipita indica DSM 11827]
MDDMLEYHDPELGWEVNASPIKRIEAGLVGQVALFKDILGDLINASVVQARNPIDQREIRRGKLEMDEFKLRATSLIC